MKKLILFALVSLCVSCAEQKKENSYMKESVVAGKKVRCDSATFKQIDSATGKEISIRVWRCDSDYVDEVGK